MWAPLPACPRECDKSVGGNDWGRSRDDGNGARKNKRIWRQTSLPGESQRPTTYPSHLKGDLVVVVVIIIITVDGGQRSKERRKAQQFLVFPRKNVTGCILGCHGVVVAVVSRLQCSPGHYNTRRLFDERSFPFLWSPVSAGEEEGKAGLVRSEISQRGRKGSLSFDCPCFHTTTYSPSKEKLHRSIKHHPLYVHPT